MNRVLNIIINTLVWVALIGYLVVAARLCTKERSSCIVRNITVIVKDSAKQKIITPQMVKLWLSGEGMDFKNREISTVNTSKIERLVESRGFVKDANVFTTLKGDVVIELTQRRPIARVNTDNGYNFYITEDNYILPLQSHYVLYVPIITGSFRPPFSAGFVGKINTSVNNKEKKVAENYLFFSKLINFVKYIEDNDFWSAQIVQINVKDVGVMSGIGIWYEPQVELVPRAGSHVIMLGDLDNVQEKLDKLMLFYKRALEYEGWDSYKYINLKFKNQIVCTK